MDRRVLGKLYRRELQLMFRRDEVAALGGFEAPAPMVLAADAIDELTSVIKPWKESRMATREHS